MDSHEELGQKEIAASDGPLIHHSELWFEDGNIVIQAERTVYKVHKSILCKYSPLFADTLSLPQSPELAATDSYEGHPLLQMQESAGDISLFLQALLIPK